MKISIGVTRIAVLIVFMFLLLGCAKSADVVQTTPHPHQEELEAIFTDILNTMTEAFATLDDSKLPDIMVDPVLSHTQELLDSRREWNHGGSTEYDLVSLKVLEYTGTEVTIEVRYDYRDFTQNLVTGERDYGLPPTGIHSTDWDWRIEEVILVKVGNRWKEKYARYIDWEKNR